jgi:hypothetical protein
MLQVSLLLRKQEDQSLSYRIQTTTCTTYPVDVIPSFIRGVILHDPVNLRDVETPSCNISTQQDALLRIREFVKCVSTFALLLSTVNFHDRHVNVI